MLIMALIPRISRAQFQNAAYNFQIPLQNINTDDSANIVYTSYFSDLNYVHLFKCDSLNNFIWGKQISYSNTQPFQNIIKVFKNNIFVLTSYTSASFFLLTKLDSNGNFLWCKKITGTGVNITNTCISVTKQKNIYIGFGSCAYENTFLKLDSLGNFQWIKSYVIGAGQRGTIQTFKETENDGLIILSNFGNSPFSNAEIMLFEINSAGNLIWNKFYNLPVGTDARAFLINLKKDSQGNYYFAENLQGNNNNTILVKTDSLGNLIWTKMYQYSNIAFTDIYQIDIDSRGNLYTAGWGANIVGDTTIDVIMKINTIDGEIKNAWNGFGSTSNAFHPYDLKCATDNRIIVSGNKAALIGGVITAMDSSGIGMCGFYPILMTANPYPIYDTIISPFQLFPSVTVTDTIFIISPSTLNTFSYCFSNEVNEIKFDNSVSIYPNPFHSETNIVFKTEQKNATLKITDILGKEIRIINFSGENLLIEKGEMKTGIYFLQIINENRIIVTKKFIIE